MILLEDIAQLRLHLQSCRQEGKRVAFVPTMGNIHQGHLSLVKQAREIAGVVVVSLFVNPTQFDQRDDFDSYPRTLESDSSLLEAAGVDILFCPGVQEMYPNGLDMAVYVEVTTVTRDLEGASRPGHFRGMATVVCKLLNQVQPEVAIFGRKDWQQVAVIRAMISELHMPVRILDAPTVRENDGLAMSSRNSRLQEGDRKKAALLYRQLQTARDRILNGERDYQTVERDCRDYLTNVGFQVDYFTIRTPGLEPPAETDRELVILLAAWLGGTRLIDNLHLSIP